MRFENSFIVVAPADAVYNAMLDIPEVAGCVPGATVGEPAEDGSYAASVAVKVGPIRLTYGGTVRVSERDDQARAATLAARAREQRGQGSAEAAIAMHVAGEDGGSRVTVTTDLTVTGRVAQMGQGIMQEVANSMIDQFATCLQSRLGAGAEGEQPAAPAEVPTHVSGISLVFKAILARLRRVFGGR